MPGGTHDNCCSVSRDRSDRNVWPFVVYGGGGDFHDVTVANLTSPAEVSVLFLSGPAQRVT